MTPVLRDDELRLVTLTLLHERPREFTELREALRERLGGNYNVAGSVLSRLLHDLERDGSVTPSHGATKLLYATTLQGEAEVRSRTDDATRITGAADSVRARADAVRTSAAEARDTLRATLTPALERGELTQRLDAAAQSFRQQLRAAARTADETGRLTPELVARVEAEILGAQARIREELDGA